MGIEPTEDAINAFHTDLKSGRTTRPFPPPRLILDGLRVCVNAVGWHVAGGLKSKNCLNL